MMDWLLKYWPVIAGIGAATAAVIAAAWTIFHFRMSGFVPGAEASIDQSEKAIRILVKNRGRRAGTLNACHVTRYDRWFRPPRQLDVTFIDFRDGTFSPTPVGAQSSVMLTVRAVGRDDFSKRHQVRVRLVLGEKVHEVGLDRIPGRFPDRGGWSSPGSIET